MPYPTHGGGEVVGAPVCEDDGDVPDAGPVGVHGVKDLLPDQTQSLGRVGRPPVVGDSVYSLLHEETRVQLVQVKLHLQGRK